MRQMNRIIMALLGANLISSSALFADSPVFPYTYTQIVPGEEFLLVMLAPDEDTYWLDEEAKARRLKILQTYPQSGLYRNDGSTEPIWSVDWYSMSVDVSSDGVHLIRRGPWATSIADDAVSFYASGELLQRYRIRNLVDNPFLLEFTVSHFFWSSNREFDEARLEYMIETIDGNRFVFDVRTGEIVSASRPSRLLLWSMSPACAAAMRGRCTRCNSGCLESRSKWTGSRLFRQDLDHPAVRLGEIESRQL